MLDRWARGRLDPVIGALAKRLYRAGVRPDTITLTGFALGIVSAAIIAAGHPFAALLVMLASRLADGLDGAVARLGRSTDFGGYLDIVLDFAFYGAVPFGFALLDPEVNALPAAALILSFYVNGASFLAFAVMAAKRGLADTAPSEKSLFFTTGLAEATETLAVFAAACLFPEWFPVLAWAFAVICLYTALARIVLARKTFGTQG